MNSSNVVISNRACKLRTKAFLLDLEGGLIDTEPLNRKTWIKASNYFGYNPSNQELNTLLGLRKIECANQIVNWSKTSIKVADLLKIQKKFHTEILRNIRPIEGSKQLVNWLIFKKVPMAIVTSSTSTSVPVPS